MSTRFIEFADQVRQASDIAVVVGDDVKLEERHGRGWKVRSPLRQEKTASFWIYTDNQSWTDFGTMEGGDVFSYVMKRDRIDFRDAVGVLARRAGITPYWLDGGAASDPLSREAMGYLERRNVEEMLTEAIGYYHHALPTRIREHVLHEHYGFTDETIDALQIGWATGGLAHHFAIERGYSREACLRTGLFLDLGGELVDFFERRIVFPYWFRGFVVYAIGRRTEYSWDDPHEQAKYKKLLTHSDKHPYVSKTVSNEWFWGEDCVQRRVEELMITEGVTDAISAYQAGRPVISPVTVRFREKDIPKLLRLTERTDRVVIVNDADVLPDGRKPGEAGALKTATALFAAKRDVRIGALPRPANVTKIDLNEFLKAKGNEELGKVIATARRYPEHLIHAIPEKGLEPAELEAALTPVAEVVAGTPPIQRETYVRQIAKRFSLPKRTVANLIAGFAPAEAPPTDEEVKAEAAKKIAALEVNEEKLRGRVLEDLGFYYTKTLTGIEEVISSFSLRCKQRILLEQGEQLCCDAMLTNGKAIDAIIFPRSAWTSRRDFIRSFPSPDMQWTGTDDHVQGVLRLVTATEAPTRKGTMNLGYYEGADGPRWVWPSGSIAPGGFLADPDVVYVSNGSSLGARLEYTPTPRAELVELGAEVLPSLLALNAPDVIMPILGWFFACPFKPRLAKLLGHFPILFIWGTMGSGKTSIIREIFWPLSGIAGRTDPYSCTETEFAMMKQFSATNSIPMVLDEFKPRGMGKLKTDKLLRMMRRIYGGEVEERGRADQSVNTYYLQAPVCLMGETMIEGDPALVERMLCVSPDKNYLQDSPAAVERFHALRTMPLARMAGPMLQWTLSRDVEADVAKARAATDELLTQVQQKGKVPPRVYDNLLVMVFGIVQYEAWAAELGITVPDVDGIAAFHALTKNILEGEGAQVKDAFDGFLESLSSYAHRGLLEEGMHYALVNGTLALHLPSCHDVYLEERRKTGREDDTNGPRALKRIALEKLQRGSYITQVDARAKLGDSLVRCVLIDMSLVPEILDFEPFPAKKPREWGGAREGSGRWGGWGNPGEA